MIEVRPFSKLGAADHGWLHARHHFSFADYWDPDRMAWGDIRVWNDDEIAPGTGFPPHPHANMEIITYVRDGAITHEDSMGNKGRTEAGDVQVMSAGTGVRHSEYNQEDVTTRLFQIWILPTAPGGAPSWGTRSFPKTDRSGHFVVLASGYPEDTEALSIRANARISGATIKQGETLTLLPAKDAKVYLVSTKGVIDVNGVTVHARDGAAIEDVDRLTLTAAEEAEVVVVETR